MRYSLGRAACVAFAVIIVQSPLHAGEAPLFQAVPDWVVNAGALTADEAKGDGIILYDRQQKVDGDIVVSYSDFALRATSAEQLARLGTLAYRWHPDKGDLIVHSIEIIRDGQQIDVIKSGNKFTVLRREQNLEQDWIDGTLTATMQIEGLKVGDILRARISLSFSDKAMGGNIEAAQTMVTEPVKIARGNYRIIWPQNRALQWKGLELGVEPKISKTGKFVEISVPQPLPKPADKPKSAPLRFAAPALFEVSSFSNWRDVSKVAAGLYAVADGMIPAGSPLAARVAAIAAGSSDKTVRAAAALRVVQDEIRYLFNGQTQGNYVPQAPMQTWDKRYGDCKAKTLLLLAILRDLGIEAEPVLVNSLQGDIVASRLPSLGAFNHVLVRATIDGKRYWLDGTLLGTRLADLGDLPNFVHALPLRPAGSDLEAIGYKAPARPTLVVETDVDATAGIGLPTPYKLKLTIRDASIARLRQAQGFVEGKKLDEILDKLVGEYLADTTIIKRSLSFDDEAATATVSAEGITSFSWQQPSGRLEAEFGTIFSGFDLDYDRNRPAWKDVPVAADTPNFIRYEYSVRLPAQAKGFEVKNPKSASGRFGPYDMSIATRIESGIFHIDSSWKSEMLEIPAANLPAERAKLARVNAGQLTLVAPPDHPQSWREFRSARASGLAKPLLAAYAANIAQDTENPDAYLLRANFLANSGDDAGAIADISKALTLRADESSYLWRARLYRRTDTKKAMADVLAAREINPSSSQAAAQAARIFLKERRFDEAIAVIDEALPLQKDKSTLLTEKAETLARAGRGSEAVALMNEANQEKSGDTELLNGRCWARALANLELPAALKDCTKAIELTEDPAGFLDSRGLVYLRMQRYEDAIADFDAALRLNPWLPGSLFSRGVARQLIGQGEAGKRDIDDAIMLYPDVAEDYATVGVKPK